MGGESVRITSWNVNGLRPALKRTAHKSLLSFLNSLDAGG